MQLPPIRVIFAVLTIGLTSCTTPRPEVMIRPETRAQDGPIVRAHITPNQFAVTEVIVEFGRRPSTAHGVAILYNSSSYNLPPPPLPTTLPFDVSFSLVGGPNQFRAGEIVDYQFKVTHLNENNNPIFFWSQRRSFQVESSIGGADPGGRIGGIVQPDTPNLLPAPTAPGVSIRSFGLTIHTSNGDMVRVNDFLCAGLQLNNPATVDVPDLSWGVSGVNIEAVNVGFDVQLRDPERNTLLDTLNLPQGFPANTPLVLRKNYPGRATTIRVVLAPKVQVNGEETTFNGCFTEPGSSPTFDPPKLLIRVDPNNIVNEGSQENDNDLLF